MERFLKYSMMHHTPVRVLMIDLKYRNITVTALDAEKVTCTDARHKIPYEIPLEHILSASYARGDDGDNLKYALQEELVRGKIEGFDA